MKRMIKADNYDDEIANAHKAEIKLLYDKAHDLEVVLEGTEAVNAYEAADGNELYETLSTFLDKLAAYMEENGVAI